MAGVGLRFPAKTIWLCGHVNAIIGRKYRFKPFTGIEYSEPLRRMILSEKSEE